MIVYRAYNRSEQGASSYTDPSNPSVDSMVESHKKAIKPECYKTGKLENYKSRKDVEKWQLSKT